VFPGGEQRLQVSLSLQVRRIVHFADDIRGAGRGHEPGGHLELRTKGDEATVKWLGEEMKCAVKN
jgi:hypothetical protein